MCMRNININAVLADIKADSDISTISLENINQTPKLEYDGKERKIPQLSMAVLLSATQPKDKEEIKKLNPEDTVVFDRLYDIRVRLTETISGHFMNLDTFEIRPADYSTSHKQCKDTFTKTYLGLYQNIMLPEEESEEHFVIKVLIRLHKDNRLEDNGWIVQTILPITLQS